VSGPILLALRLLLAVALYAFLVWALWLMWRDLRQQSRQLAAPAAPPLILTLKNDGAELTYRFTTAEVIIGRDPTCNLRLDEKTLSARHARLSYHHGQWWVEDLHSTNGTLLNAERVSEPVVAAAGDLLRCGAVLFEVNFEPT
jgi:pSer/pThr/pTyr-binding forkhead associated (FHA) protein